jgi:hypothetical protein
MQLGLRILTFLTVVLLWLCWLEREAVEEIVEDTAPETMAIKVQPVPESEPIVEESLVPEPMPEPEPVIVEVEQETHPVPAFSESKVPDQLPAISASYENSIGFSRYVRAMQQIGGRFFIYDDTRNKLLDAVDPLSGRVSAVETDSLVGLSPRLRELGYEPEMEQVLLGYQLKAPRSRIKWVLLLPQTVEGRIAAQLREAFRTGELPAGDWTRAEAEYQASAAGVVLELRALRARDGHAQAVRLNLSFASCVFSGR